jgi:hypothetical protein
MDDPADKRSDLERAIAERERAFAAGEAGYRPQRHWQYGIGLILAALVVFVVFFGFDAFLGGMQKMIEIIVAREEAEVPIPVFVVPDSPPP